ncbi:Ppx/GppA phosphatase [Fluviicola taffensis]|uniref:Ppx/GppA phosphatase n=1 Tax=Fluviicola taffensis (strain DSM 16823 / NCIMB 13979 / RW262) TaxID=755732 RepID=F2ICL3_FLUTR|nr:Ppx/GppA phosphatase [Fluviicola taffensis]AEA42240.1 Ppx/GppA phosphatase [Fluviicola taffensis DSM 16823]
MRAAVIDLGTNTFNLLVADVHADDFDIVHNSKEGVALGMGGINEGTISDEAMQRAFHAFEKFKKICDDLTVSKIIGVGTSAVRDADNNSYFIREIKKRFDIDIEIVDGLEEAMLIYQGVSWSYQFEQTSLIMDIGGGSTEFIRVENEKDLQFFSANIGVSRAIQLFELGDPLTALNQQELLEWFELNSKEMNHFAPCEVLVGASGSFETFYEMVHEEEFPKGLANIRLSREDLIGTLNWIIESTFEERENHPFIIPIRRKMAPIAALKTKWVVEKFDIKEIVISPCSLKEGVLRRFF